MQAFEPGEVLRLLGDPEQGITHFFAVPAPYQFMMQYPDFRRHPWIERGVSLMQGFGMTETSPACIALAAHEALRKIGSTGKTLVHSEFRIVNEDGGDCEPDEIGELWDPERHCDRRRASAQRHRQGAQA